MTEKISLLERAMRAERTCRQLDEAQQALMKAIQAQQETIRAATGYRDEMEAALEEFSTWVDPNPDATQPELLAATVEAKLRELKLWRSKADKVFQAHMDQGCCDAARALDGKLVAPDTPVPLRACEFDGSCRCVLIDP